MKSKDIILYRFNKELDTALLNLSILKKQNPNIRIYGLNGGNKNRPDQTLTKKYLKEFSKYLEHIYYIKHEDWEWKWKNGDLAMREWFIDYGQKIDFERMYFTEWDVVYLDNIINTYKHIPREEKSIALTGIVSILDIEKYCAPNYQWLYRKGYKEEFMKLQNHLMDKYNHIHLKYTCCFPTGYMTKQFLIDYSKLDVSEDSHDELRVPAYAEILGYTIFDTEFSLDRFSDEDRKFYNTNALVVDYKLVLKEAKKGDIRRRVFHPFRSLEDLKKIEHVLVNSAKDKPLKRFNKKATKFLISPLIESGAFNFMRADLV